MDGDTDLKRRLAGGRRFAVAALAIGCALGGAAHLAAAPAGDSDAIGGPAREGAMRIYIGTYTGGKSEGIYSARFDRGTGELSGLELVAKAKNPSFLALHPSKPFVYAVNELGSFEGAKSGAVSAFARRPDGRLEFLNQKASSGGAPCHIVTDSAGTHVLVANYTGGNVAVIGIEGDGRLGETTSVKNHKGSSKNPDRQEGPHAHSIHLDAAGRFAFAADLGLDQVLVYRFGGADGSLAPHDPPFARVMPGAGPRHFAFHPTSSYAYVINELGNTVTAFRYNAELGTLETIHSISTLPREFSGTSYTAEVLVHPSGKFLYGSNRGHDSIAVFAIDSPTGRLSALEHEPTGGKTPRNFGIDPAGNFLLAANQASDSIVVFRIDAETGKLEPTGHRLDVPTPVCVKFIAE